MPEMTAAQEEACHSAALALEHALGMAGIHEIERAVITDLPTGWRRYEWPDGFVLAVGLSILSAKVHRRGRVCENASGCSWTDANAPPERCLP